MVDARQWAAGALLLVLGGCDGCPAARVASPRDGAVVNAWLECIECADSEFDSVLAHGPALRDTLVTLLVSGAPVERRQRLFVHLAEAYAELSSSADTTGGAVLPDSAAYTNMYLRLLSNRYQKRSAVALAEMGGATGRVALEQAVIDSLSYPVNLRLAIRLARDTARVRFR